MDPTMLQRFRYNLVEQRQNLIGWLTSAPTRKKLAHLGPADEQAVQTRLQILETTIEKAEDQTLGVCEVCYLDVEPSRLEIDYTTCVCLDIYRQSERDIERARIRCQDSANSAAASSTHTRLELAVYSRPVSYPGTTLFQCFVIFSWLRFGMRSVTAFQPVY
jgi:RNA polymerase-binding transcription factor DksA